MSGAANTAGLQGTPKAPLWTRDFVLISITNFLLCCGFQMFPSALPPYVKSLGASDSIMGWMMGSLTIATLLVRPFTGNFLDKFGRRGGFMGGLLLMIAATAAMYFFPVVGIIIFIRVLQGFGWGIASTACNTIASDYIPKSRFGEGIGFFSLSISLAIALAPLVALSVTPGAMILSATALTAAALLLALTLRYPPIKPPAAHDGKRPSLYEKASILPSAIMFMVTSTYGAVLTFIAIYADSRGIGNIGMFFTFSALSMLLARLFMGLIVDRYGYGVAIIPGLVALVLALVLLACAHSLPAFLCSALLYGLGQGSVHSSTQTMAVTRAPAHRVGAANATFYTGFDAGIGFGAIVSGFLSIKFGYGNMFIILSVLPLSGVFLYFWGNGKNARVTK